MSEEENALERLVISNPKERQLADALRGFIGIQKGTHEVFPTTEFYEANQRVQAVSYLLGTAAANKLAGGQLKSEVVCPSNEFVGDVVKNIVSNYSSLERINGITEFTEVQEDCLRVTDIERAAQWLMQNKR